MLKSSAERRSRVSVSAQLRENMERVEGHDGRSFCAQTTQAECHRHETGLYGHFHFGGREITFGPDEY